MLVTADQGGHSRAPQILRDTTDTSRYQVDTHPIPLDYHVRARVSPPSSSEESSRVRQSLTCTGRPPFLLGTPPLANNSSLIFNTFREGTQFHVIMVTRPDHQVCHSKNVGADACLTVCLAGAEPCKWVGRALHARTWHCGGLKLVHRVTDACQLVPSIGPFRLHSGSA